MHTVQELQDSVSAQLTGIDLSDVNDLFGCFERAASTLIQKAKVPEASGRAPFMLYDGVMDYTPDTTIWGGSLVDLRPQGIAREPWDEVEKTYIADFDRTKCRVPYGYLVTFEYRQGNPIMRIADGKAVPRISIDPMSDTSGWVASGNASGLMLDTTVYYQQPAALRFNLAVSGSEGLLTKTLTNAIDLTSYQGVGVAFLAFDPPTSSDITTVKLRLGSSPSNYYEVDVTTGFNGSFQANLYQLVAFDFGSTSTVTVGAPVNIAAINYVQLAFEYNGVALNNVRVGGLWISLPSPHEMLFYSVAVFKANATTAASKTITSVNDSIILGDPAYNLYSRECARAVALQQGGVIGGGIIAALDLELEGNGRTDGKLGLYQEFRGDNPSEELRQVGSWYP